MSKEVPQEVYGLKGGTKSFNPKGQALYKKTKKMSDEKKAMMMLGYLKADGSLNRKRKITGETHP
jgi:hypothetical protein